MPEWEVKLTIPITKEYILGDITEEWGDKRISFDQSRDSILLFITNLPLNQINLNNPDQLQINSNVQNGKICLSDIDFNLNEAFIFQEHISALLPEIPTNTLTSVPSLYGIPVQKNTYLNSFNEIYADTAEFELEIINEFPFDINLSSFILSNDLDNHNEELLNKHEIYISKNSKFINRELIINKKFFNSLKLNFNISSNGTGANSVYIDDKYALKISFLSKKVKIFHAEASFDEQDYSFAITSKLSSLGNEIILGNARLQNGIVDIVLKNHTDFSGHFIMSINDIHQNSNVFSTQHIYLPAKGNFSQKYSLAGYSITPKNNSEFTFNNSIRVNSTNNQFVTLNADDSITYSISLKDIKLSSFAGAITSNINQSFMLEKDDISNLNGNIKIKEVSASIFVNNGSSLPIKLSNSYISGYHTVKKETYTCQIKDTEIKPLLTTRINIENAEITNFFNNFANDNSIPDVFNFQFQVHINTYNSNYLITNKDTIGGYVELTIPLEAAISNLSTSGSIDLDIEQSIKEELANVNFGTLTIQCSNGVPLGGHLRILFIDDYGNEIGFPKENLDTKYKISAADVDDRGYSISEPVSSITDTFTKEDINFIKECTKCTFDVVLNSSSSKNVVIRNSDKIKLSILTEFGYTIKSK